MRADQEIIDWFNELEAIHGDDPFPTLGRFYLLSYLSQEKAETFMGGGWKQKSQERDDILFEMQDYMEFLLTRVEEHQLLTVEYGIQKMLAWIWILGDDETYAKLFTVCPDYGFAPWLKVICETYGFQQPMGPDAIWWNNMSTGRPCRHLCMQCQDGKNHFRIRKKQ